MRKYRWRNGKIQPSFSSLSIENSTIVGWRHERKEIRGDSSFIFPSNQVLSSSRLRIRFVSACAVQAADREESEKHWEEEKEVLTTWEGNYFQEGGLFFWLAITYRWLRLITPRAELVSFIGVDGWKGIVISSESIDRRSISSRRRRTPRPDYPEPIVSPLFRR